MNFFLSEKLDRLKALMTSSSNEEEEEEVEDVENEEVLPLSESKSVKTHFDYSSKEAKIAEGPTLLSIVKENSQNNLDCKSEIFLRNQAHCNERTDIIDKFDDRNEKSQEPPALTSSCIELEKQRIPDLVDSHSMTSSIMKNDVEIFL